MKWSLLRPPIAALAALGMAGCERLGLGPHRADSAQPAVAEQPAAPDLRPHGGEFYADFIAQPGLDRYGVGALGLGETERSRVEAALPARTEAQLVTGGGAEALVFAGCAHSGCTDGMTVLAIDVATGTAFLGVRDTEGADVLVPNARVEALLRLNSPSRRWDDPGLAAPAATGPAAP
jgi:hypothetical protein